MQRRWSRPSEQNPDEDSPTSDEKLQGASAGGQSAARPGSWTWSPLVEMGVPTRVYSVSLGGFDTHSDERGTQQRLLTQLDAALAAFQARLAKTDRGKQVVTAVYSEFGRRVTANASDGTDHGTAGPVFVLGRGVTGGFYGDRAEPDRPGRRRPQGRARLPYGVREPAVLGARRRAGRAAERLGPRVDGLFA